ncbi:CybS-domain-containing protein [Whalleya microplaca]|nr:CybS-domain-containing protein [Whalleya microplaca]
MASSVLRPALLLRQTARATRTAVKAAAVPTRPSFASKDAVRVAAFHASSRRSLLPPGPQVIKGTVNDPAPVPDPHPSHGSYHWTFERAVAVGLVPLTVAPFAAGTLNPGLDAILCSLMLVHSHLGLQSVIVDYVPTRQFPKSRKAAMWALNVATALVGIGLYEFETNDVGVTEAVKRVWKA